MGAVLSIAAWGRDSSGLAHAVDRAFAAVAASDSQHGAPARGRALDRAVRSLQGPADSAVLSFGAEFLFYGGRAKGNGGRVVGIPDPGDPFRTLARLAVPASPAVLAVTTVVPDPDERQPPGAAKSLTIVAASAGAAAAWGDTLLSLGCERALARGELAGVGVVCIPEGGTVRWTAGLAGRVTVTTDSWDSAGSARGPAPAR